MSSPPAEEAARRRVLIRPIKEFVRRLEANHPLRLALAGEPDEMDSAEYLVKLSVWLRLMPEDGR
ncbi:MAG: hypothetical protein ACREDK_06165 [Thermoplasmata archaeon]